MPWSGDYWHFDWYAFQRYWITSFTDSFEGGLVALTIIALLIDRYWCGPCRRRREAKLQDEERLQQQAEAQRLETERFEREYASVYKPSQNSDSNPLGTVGTANLPQHPAHSYLSDLNPGPYKGCPHLCCKNKGTYY